MSGRNTALSALLVLLGAAAEPSSPPTPAAQWPMLGTASEPASVPTLELVPRRPRAPPGWPGSNAATAPDPFTAAAAEQRPVLLPLRRCGIVDCLRPAADADMTADADPTPTLDRLLNPFPADRPTDRRHVIALLVAVAICTLLWRHRTRRARGGY